MADIIHLQTIKHLDLAGIYDKTYLTRQLLLRAICEIKSLLFTFRLL